MSISKQPSRFILTDASNLFFRQIKMCNPQLGIDSAIGMALHLILYSMKKEYTRWQGSHCVIFMEGRSWRKDYYTGYKADRAVTFALQTEKEQEDHKILVETFDDFIEYLDNKTNMTVLQNPRAEADDNIAIWIEAHPDDKHILISSDSDFFQLLRYPNVTLYDPVKDIIIKQDGVYDDKGKKLSFVLNGKGKIKAGKADSNFICEEKWYEWALFLKCIRGDATDNIFSAYPNVRENGTKNQVGIREAYEDRSNQGYNWNNFMQQKWIDHNEVEQKVKDRYEFNRKLIDLNEIPNDIKIESLGIIAEETGRKNIPAIEIGHHFMKFTGKHDLKKIGDNALAFMPMLKSKYKEDQ